MKKLTYTEILAAQALLSALPLDVAVKEKDGEYTRSLSGKLTGRVLSLVANLNLHAKHYAELEEQARTAAKSDGFDQRYNEYLKNKEADNDYIDESIEKEFAETNHRFSQALIELRQQEVDLIPAIFNHEEFEQITEHTNGAVIKINGNEVPRLYWLVDLEQILVEP